MKYNTINIKLLLYQGSRQLGSSKFKDFQGPFQGYSDEIQRLFSLYIKYNYSIPTIIILSLLRLFSLLLNNPSNHGVQIGHGCASHPCIGFTQLQHW